MTLDMLFVRTNLFMGWSAYLIFWYLVPGENWGVAKHILLNLYIFLCSYLLMPRYFFDLCSVRRAVLAPDSAVCTTIFLHGQTPLEPGNNRACSFLEHNSATRANISQQLHFVSITCMPRIESPLVKRWSGPSWLHLAGRAMKKRNDPQKKSSGYPCHINCPRSLTGQKVSACFLPLINGVYSSDHETTFNAVTFRRPAVHKEGRVRFSLAAPWLS
jgi:hypothetical protein